MKHTVKIITVILMIALAVTLAACAHKEADITGSWKLTGGPLTEQIAEIENTNSPISISLIFDEDGSFIIETSAFSEFETFEAGYSISDNLLTLTGSPISDVCEFKLDGDTLTIFGLDMLGGDVILTRE